MVHSINYLYKEENEGLLKAIYSYNGIESEKFKGDVMYVGMGSRYLEKSHTEDVTSVTYIEKDENIISLFGEGTKVIKGDAFEVELEEKFDILLLDIWDKKMCLKKKNSELIRLKKRFENNLKEGGKILHLKSVFAPNRKIKETI